MEAENDITGSQQEEEEEEEEEELEFEPGEVRLIDNKKDGKIQIMRNDDENDREDEGINDSSLDASKKDKTKDDEINNSSLDDSKINENNESESDKQTGSAIVKGDKATLSPEKKVVPAQDKEGPGELELSEESASEILMELGSRSQKSSENVKANKTSQESKADNESKTDGDNSTERNMETSESAEKEKEADLPPKDSHETVSIDSEGKLDAEADATLKAYHEKIVTLHSVGLQSPSLAGNKSPRSSERKSPRELKPNSESPSKKTQSSSVSTPSKSGIPSKTVPKTTPAKTSESAKKRTLVETTPSVSEGETGRGKRRKILSAKMAQFAAQKEKAYSDDDED